MKQFIYEKLASELKDKIALKIWRSNERLPSIRQLSDEYKVSKISVQTALHKLEASGLIQAKPKSGYYVVPEIKKKNSILNTSTLNKPSLIKVPNIFHEIMEHSAAFDIYPAEKIKKATNHIDLLNRHINRAMRKNPIQNSLYYDNPEGAAALQSQISEHYRTRNLYVNSNDICITSGCQNSLFLALTVCCNAGDTVVIESPAFYGCLQLLQHLKLRVIEISSSSNIGINSKELKDILKKWEIKACIVTPNFSTPTGSSLPAEEKKQLVALTQEYNFTLIEDDIYGDLAFHLTSEPLKSFDKKGNVILCSSFSKALSRDLRIGWIIGGKKHSELVQLKLVNYLATNQAIQQGLASFMAEGSYRRHLIQYRELLQKQRDTLIKCIKDNWQFSYTFSLPNGGLSIWIELEKTIDTTEIYKHAIKEGIIITPGILFSSNKQFSHCMRLSFVHEITGKRLTALKKIGNLIKSYL